LEIQKVPTGVKGSEYCGDRESPNLNVFMYCGDRESPSVKGCPQTHSQKEGRKELIN